MSTVDIGAIAHIARHAAVHTDHIAVVYEGNALNYGELYEHIGRFASGLRADGIGPGDRVAYAGHNSLAFLATMLAANWVGAAFVPLNFRLAGPELAAIIIDARPDVLVAESHQAHLIDADMPRLAIRRPLLIDDDPAAPAEHALTASWGSYAAFRTEHRELHPSVPQHDDDVAALLYTSGTTGRPKGVILTHGNLWWNWVNVDSVVDTRVGDVTLAVAPMFHIGGLNAFTLRTLTRGGTVIVHRVFDPDAVLTELVSSRVNSIFLVPAMLAAIERVPGFADAELGALRSTIVAGAPVPPSLIERFTRKGVALQQAWGLTETAPFATYLEAAMTGEKLGSCGQPMPYTSVRLVDPATLRPIDEPDTMGEMWVRGPNVSPGYWNNPEATGAAFTDDGWFRTGDLGRTDAQGYFYIVDRLKDMVISGGENIYPAEIENVLGDHDGIADVAVIGVADERWGEAVCAVAAFAGEPSTLDELREWLASRIARYKLPRRLVVVERVPRNGAGKLDKVALRALVAELSEREIANTDAPPFTEAVRLPSVTA